MISASAAWGGIAVIVILNIIGWVISFNRYSRNEAVHLSEFSGELSGKMDGLDKRMESLESRMGNLESRLDGFFTNLARED